MAQLRCYVASPLGFTEGGREYYRTNYLPALSSVVEPVDPWSLATAEELALAGDHDPTIRLELGRRNAHAIRSCQLLVAYLDGQEVDSGTAAEVGFAAALGIRCLGLRTDLRVAGDFGARVNLQVESFIVESGGTICSSLRELVDELHEIVDDPARGFARNV
ncbi:MAG TPA: nucleoside 2-deoxyribosyltransferase [Solirubrobacteraceae bacterium]|nr:nucleoside 2-deoxyribosyltransferase [Solirubrobacteraceae bacterium]